jgi:AraC family transcriptional regulator, regulatory protein of adaptative response / methylated-DNA-[protein]-cysteine methyltransferase
MGDLAMPPDAASAAFPGDERRWQAVQRRDRAADGRFWYSVRTTGVYCRPSCASRLARRENVRFHVTRGEAERAGFRPCKRCRPDGRADARPSGGAPAESAGQAEASISFAVGDSSLGAILVATTAKGVCAILLGDDPEALVHELRGRFPEARPVGAKDGPGQLVGQVAGFVEAPARGLDLTLDVRGTGFQHRVWQALREIPAGSTASYPEIAERIGAAKEAYAVGEACAANVIAVAIPCHRVVRKDGTLGGYRWGLRRKRALLRREGAR